REQLAKIADLLKRLKERQEGLTTEAERIQNEVLQGKTWDRGHLFSLRDLGTAQRGLGEETTKVAKDNLPDAVVFARILRKAAKAMDEAAQEADDHYLDVRVHPQKTDPDEEIAKSQHEAVRRLDQLLDAIKPDANGGPRQAAGGG